MKFFPIALFTSSLFYGFSSYGQQLKSVTPEAVADSVQTGYNDAEYPGGIDRFQTLLSIELHSYAQQHQLNATGTMKVKFAINRNGKLINPAIIQSLSPDIDSMILVALNRSSIWHPAQYKGQPITASYIIPLSFEKSTANESVSESNEVYTSVHQNPEFIGGMEQFYAFLGKQIRYPQDAIKKKISGRVLLTMVIEKDGSVTNVHILKGTYSSLDAEALRVVSLSPNWIPGKVNDKAVRCITTLPVVFTIL